MCVFFRVDSSVHIGIGHLMRCLTLADGLNEKGVKCHFIHRSHPGHLAKLIESRGYQVTLLSPPKPSTVKVVDGDYDAWLGVSQKKDAEETIEVLGNIKPKWLIVDHYALGSEWECRLKPYTEKIFVIDDIANRSHACDLLLDQNYGSSKEKYSGYLDENCLVLAGSKYALLRPEFAQWRDYSLRRRDKSKGLNSILINFGGVDSENYTGRVLEQINKSNIASSTVITVVMGASAPHTELIRNQSKNLPFQTIVKSNVKNMAELMSNADLAIGAAGATSWERCCLGLPTIQLVIAENQRLVADMLSKENAVKVVDDVSEITDLLERANDFLSSLSQRCRRITDGLGCQNVLMELNK